MKQRESVKFEPLKTGDYVALKDSFRLQQGNAVDFIREEIGEPPYVVIEPAGRGPEGPEMLLRSQDQRKYPLKMHDTGYVDPEIRMNSHSFIGGTVQIPMRYLEKVTPPRPELNVGRIVRLKLDVLARSLPSFQYEAIKGKFDDKECKVLRIIETQSVKDPTQVNYFAMITLKDSDDKDSLHAVPVEGLETVH